jgi:hypothetical protein
VLAGPFATMVLGDLGAEVVKIERPGSGDETRSEPVYIEELFFLGVTSESVALGDTRFTAVYCRVFGLDLSITLCEDRAARFAC